MEKTFIPHEIEAHLCEQWAKRGTFNYNPEHPGKPFCIIMPPPNVTGSLHMGHALTFTLQDILIRYRRKQGDNVLWQPGTDHAGIVTQMLVERQIGQEGLTRYDLGREKFLERIWQWKAQSGNTIHGQLVKLGASVPWHRDCFTMDESISTAVRKVFTQLYRDGLIYRDKRLVHWDIQLQSALSDLEVNNKPSTDGFYHIHYPSTDNPQEGIVVATTRPETLFGDVAICVNPDDARYKAWIGRTVFVPIVNRPIPVIADEWSDPELGTGAVKITPAHDFNDFEVAKRHQLPALVIMDSQGCLIDPAPTPYVGMDRFMARKKVLEELTELGLLVAETQISHTLPHGDRSDTILEPRLTDQWFVKAEILAQKALQAVESDQTKFVPEFWTATYYEWMRNIQPWCISRQIWWGHRIPAWYGPDGKIFVAETEEEAQEQAQQHYLSPQPLTQDNDVLDTWFSSALWPFVTLGWPTHSPELSKNYPSTVLITGHDIIFFWVARMMMMGLYIMDDIPFKDVYIHALVRDEKGQKMSKSKGNVIDPVPLIETYGADALRFTLALQAAPGRDIKFSTSRIEGAKHFMTKLWNAVRFCLVNKVQFDNAFQTALVQHPVNAWIIQHMSQLQADVYRALDGYCYHEAAHVLYQSIWGTFCDWYLEFSKPLITDVNPTVVSETRATAAWVLSQYLHLLNPFMPYLTESLWAALMGYDIKDTEVYVAEMTPDDLSSLTTSVQTISVSWAIGLIEEVRSIWSTLGLPQQLKCPAVFVTTNADEHLWVETYKPLICRLTRLAQIDLVQGIHVQPKSSLSLPYGHGQLFIAVGDVLDIDQETKRLEKEIQKLDSDLKKMEAKLANHEFMQKAPEAVVTDLKERQTTTCNLKQKLIDTCHRLAVG